MRFQLHTLQLLPGAERPSYAGAAVEVLEHTQRPSPNTPSGRNHPLPAGPRRDPGCCEPPTGPWLPTTELNRVVKRLGNHRLSQSQLRHLANLEPDPVADDDNHVVNGDSEPQLPAFRELTPRQLALSKAVRQAKVQGLALREIARQLGIKYAHALIQPTNRPHNRGTEHLSKTNRQTLGLTKSLSI